MDSAALSSLTGLCFDLVGAFLLAAEAIGLERIRSWQKRVMDRPAHILCARKTGEMAQRAEKSGLRWLPGVAIGIASGMGAYVGSFVSLSIKRPGLPSWFPLLIGILPGGVVGFFFIDLIVFLLRSSSKFLVWVQNTAGRGTIGIAGFLFLAMGFLLQFVGTLTQALS